MKVADKMLIKHLANAAEVVNTLNGGMAEPRLHLERQEKEWLLHVRIPGVSAENLKLEIKDHQLFIFQMLTQHNVADVELPYLIAMLQIGQQVDLDEIVAEYEDGHLYVHMPVDEEASGYEREVSIVRK